jgi:hypothetical protein
MLRGFARSSIILALFLTAAGARAAPTPPVRLPPGSHPDRAGDGGYVSSRGLRDTTHYLARRLARAGIAVDQIGPYRVRGVELTRFVSRTPSTPWLAIHVLRTAGKTLIFFVARPSS